MNRAIESQLDAAHKAIPKKIRLVEAIYESPKTSFELEKHPTYDHCPNSTVSELRKAGIEIHTEMVTIPGYGGEPARIALGVACHPHLACRARVVLQAALSTTRAWRSVVGSVWRMAYLARGYLMS